MEVSALEQIGTITFMLLFFSPVLAIIRIIRDSAVNGFSPYPYVGLFLSNLMGIICSQKAVTGHWNQMRFNVCLFGLFLEGMLVMLFVTYASSERQRAWVLIILCVGIFIMISVLVPVMIFYPVRIRREIMESLLTVFWIIAYVSPLAVCLRVYVDRKVEFMPLLPILALMIHSALFIAISFKEKNNYVRIWSIVGLASGTVQLIFYGTYLVIEKAEHSIAELRAQLEIAQQALEQQGGNTSSQPAQPAQAQQGGNTSSQPAQPAQAQQGGNTSSQPAQPAQAQQGGNTSSQSAQPAQAQQEVNILL